MYLRINKAEDPCGSLALFISESSRRPPGDRYVRIVCLPPHIPATQQAARSVRLHRYKTRTPPHRRTTAARGTRRKYTSPESRFRYRGRIEADKATAQINTTAETIRTTLRRKRGLRHSATIDKHRATRQARPVRNRVHGKSQEFGIRNISRYGATVSPPN